MNMDNFIQLKFSVQEFTHKSLNTIVTSYQEDIDVCFILIHMLAPAPSLEFLNPCLIKELRTLKRIGMSLYELEQKNLYQ